VAHIRFNRKQNHPNYGFQPMVNVRDVKEMTSLGPLDLGSHAKTPQRVRDHSEEVYGNPSSLDHKKPMKQEPTKEAPFIVAIFNQKGGTGKTTTTINLGAALANMGFRILLVDLDPQGHTTIGTGIDPDFLFETMAEVMSIPHKSMADIIKPTYIPQLHVAPAHINLANVAEKIYRRVFRETILLQALKKLDYDFIFIDCPPSLGVLTINSLYACNFIIIPCQMARYSLEGLADLLTTVGIVKNLGPHDLNEGDYFRILLTMFDKRNSVTNRYVFEELKPYRDKTFQTVIMRNEPINQAQIEQKAIFDFDPICLGSNDYRKLSLEFLELYRCMKESWTKRGN
jgi:chromosome partitioning protein